MSATLTQAEINTGWWNVNCCNGKFRGLMTAHCPTCHETFTSPPGFDYHRRAGKCLNPATLRNSKTKEPIFQKADRGYPCWMRNGSYVRDSM